MVLNILDYRKYSENGSDWTDAFTKAVADIKQAGGGTLSVPAGVYKTANITLTSNMTLELQEGSELSFFDDFDRYEIIRGSFEGVMCDMYKPFVYAKDEVSVTISGKGIINGNGEKWWKALLNKELNYMRPRLVYFEKCTDVELMDITVTNSPCWTIHPYWCDNVKVMGVKVKNPASSPNTDGINPDSCRNVVIKNCKIDVGDDCIAIKSGVEQSDVLRSCENILIEGCEMVHGHGGVVLGSESSGGIAHVMVKDCHFEDTDRGVRYKTRRRRGGHVYDICFENVTMKNVMCPFVFNMFYFCGKFGKESWVADPNPAPVDEGTPSLADLKIHNVKVYDARSCAGIFAGLPEQKVSGVSFKDCFVSMKQGEKPEIPAMMSNLEPQSAAGFILKNTENVIFENVRLENYIGEEYQIMDDSKITVR